MGVDLIVQVVVGVDAEEPGPKGSLLDRFLAGGFGEEPEVGPDAEPEVARGAMEEWFQEHEPGGLSAWVAGNQYEEGNEDARVVVGVEVLQLWNRDSVRLVEGPVALNALRAAMARAREGLRELGVQAEPRLLLLWRAS